MEQLNRFTNKVVVITGAGRGIGRGIALRFAREGAHVVVSDVIAEIDDVAEEIRALGAEALPIHCDVTDKAAVEALYVQAIARFGKIDISLQNAGVITIATVDAMTEAEWDRVMVVASDQ